MSEVNVEPAAPFILTLTLNEEARLRFNALRQRYFPPERNHIGAHLTLFHKLPGAGLDHVRAVLALVAARQQRMRLGVTGLRFLGRGVAYDIDAPAARALHRQLSELFHEWLTSQDKARFAPHITIQNKVSPAVARATLDDLAASFQPMVAYGEGLDLWHYRGGPWDHVVSLPFAEQTGEP